MNLTDIIGSLGVFMLLAAFFMNIINMIHKKSYIYILMNLTGAALACMASVFLNYLPFVVLEGAWTLVSGIALIRKIA